MMNRRSFSFAAVFLSIFVITALISCGGGSSSSEGEGKISHQENAMEINFPVPKFLRAAGISDLQCHAFVDHGEPIPLTVDGDNSVSGTFDAPAKTITLELIYFVFREGKEILLCTYSNSSITVLADSINTVSILDSELNRNYDDDFDGFTNLAEVRIGTNALDRADVPPGESPYVLCGNGIAHTAESVDYTAYVVVGSAVAGRASSAGYRLVVTHTGW
jgi:hypothetical protein